MSFKSQFSETGAQALLYRVTGGPAYDRILVAPDIDYDWLCAGRSFICSRAARPRRPCGLPKVSGIS
jgi:hypothetical protein